MVWIGAAGACVGSFLNMLIYRLPRERSLLKPPHSFCPQCDARIRWYDNIPLLSYLLLRGRCRACAQPIPLRYPLVEGLCAVGFILIFDAFYVGAIRPDVQSPAASTVTGQVGASWPILVGHLVMFAGLLAVSAMDLEEYYVDVRLTWLIVGVGLACSLANGSGGVDLGEIAPVTAGVAVAAGLGLVLSTGVTRLWASNRHVGPEPEAAVDSAEQAPSEVGEEMELAAEEPPSEFTEAATREAEDEALGNAARREPRTVWGCLLAILGLAAVFGGGACASMGGWGYGCRLSAPVRLAFGFAALCLALLGASIRSRPADRYIVEAIESERGQARRGAAMELMFLLPAFLFGMGAWWWMTRGGGEAAAEVLLRILAWPASSSWRPAQGFLSALVSMLVAGGIGWGVRIVFTSILGKEAFGLGDVHIMWASGAVVGWAVVVLGFFAGAFLAMAGMALLLGFKRSRAIPFGPWLALGMLAVTLWRKAILVHLGPAGDALRELLTNAGP
jgi:prepilin signal peptidase PulO-like enzyme (type II secretory pathway)